jgi:hypothetical protein
MPGTWKPLTHQPTFNTSTSILLSDGRIMFQEEATNHWHALTPDKHGSYVDGTWSTLADMSFWRRYYASGMLKDGRIVLIGGEQSGAGGDTNKGEIYDPVTNKWTPMPSPPGWANVGDASCCILPNGDLIIGSISSGATAIFNPVTNSWAAGGSLAVDTNEETWILLPDDTIVTAQCFAPYHSERYSISSDTWKNEGALPVSIVDPVMHEIGPAMLMYNGKVIWFGAADVAGHGKTVIYTPPAVYTGTGTWTQGPDIPKIGGQTIVCNDCPGALLPNGKVLAACAPFAFNNWGSPIFFIEYDPFGNTIVQAPTPPNNGAQLFWSRFMLTPTGQVLFSPSSSHVECYTPNGGPQDAWRPVIKSVTLHSTGSAGYFHVDGLQLNGLSQANVYGDDCNPATNYPLVRLRNLKTGDVYFARTYHFSTRAVSAPNAPQSFRFTAKNVPYGEYELCVIANGISSHCHHFHHERPHKGGGTVCPPAECACGCREECKPDRCGTAVLEGEPEIVELRDEVKRLHAGLHRLDLHIEVEEPHREGKERRKEEKEERKKK